MPQPKTASHGADCRRSKCDGCRPSCRTCRARTLQCRYSADADATPIVALKRRYYAVCQARADDRAMIDRLRSALNARDLDASQNRGTIITVRDKPNIMSNPAEGNINLAYDTGAKSPHVDAFQHCPSLPCDQASFGLATVLQSPSFRGDGQHQGNHAMLLLQAMASKSDIESTAMLARLRMGHDWRKIANDPLNNQTILGTHTR